jgi:hypothetical protein
MREARAATGEARETLMASGFVNSANQDLDSVFAPRYSGWPEASGTEFVIVGYGDLNARYAPLSTGSAAAVTGFVISSGADLNAIFAAYGSTNVQVLTQPSAISGSAAAGNPSGTVTSNTASCAGTKGGGSYTYTWHIASGSGFSLTTPNSQTCGITGTIPAGQTVFGGIYCTISDGVTSVNTNTVGCSLQNTTPAGVIGQLTAGSVTDSTGTFTGFDDSPGGYAIGSWSLTSGVVPNGGVIETLYDSFITHDNGVLLGIRVSSNPGQGWFTTLICNGNTLNSSGALYSYSGGVASWAWQPGLLGITSGDTYTVTFNL